MAINVTNVRNVTQGITNMSDYGAKAAVCFSKISEELKDFNKVWKGGIYEKVVNSFDSIVDDFNNLTNYITVEVPDVINSSMEYMASVNEVSYTPPSISTAKPIEYVNAATEDNAFMYDKASFERKQNEIRNSIKEARQQISLITDEVNNGSFKNGFGENDSTYEAIKSNVGTMIQTILNDVDGFESSFNSALDEVSTTEQKTEQSSVDNINQIM